MKKLLLLLACAFMASIDAMESESNDQMICPSSPTAISGSPRSSSTLKSPSRKGRSKTKLAEPEGPDIAKTGMKDKSSRKESPTEQEAPMPITLKYQRLIHARDWKGISKLEGLDRMMTRKDAIAIIAMAEARYALDNKLLDASTSTTPLGHPIPQFIIDKHEASTIIFRLVSDMLTPQRGNN